jgi:glycosyltransferase involved in cell wall biosynthesis
VRLGIYSDDVFRRDDGVTFTDRAFIHFVSQLTPRIDEVVLLGRLAPKPGRGPYALPAEGVRVAGLPHYESVRALGPLLRSLGGARRVFAEELSRLDAVLVFGPHPLALLLVAAARRRGVPVVLGVRQDLPTYIRNRLPSRRWAWAVGAAYLLEWSWRLLARRRPAVVVGEALGRAYSGGPAPVLVTSFSLVPAEAIVPLPEALARVWEEPLRVLSVGRLDREKNPLLLVDVLARLRESGDWRLTVVGTGPLAEAVERRAQERGVRDAVELAGYVPSGPELWAHYRDSHAFLHVSLTEGLPQVLVEAHAAGIPVVGTAVGGVAAALGGGESGLLIPPEDAEAAVAALRRLAAEPELRERLISAGHERAQRETIERQLDDLAAFVRAAEAELVSFEGAKVGGADAR